MANIAIKKIQKEIADIRHSLHSELPENISVGPADENNLFLWNATIIGPTKTPYEGGLFKLQIHFPATYPFKPPVVKFLTRIFHPNINEIGEICLDILKTQWSPALSITQVLLSISSLLSDPNPNDPLNPDAAHLYKNNRKQYNLMVEDYVNRFAF